MADHRAPTRRQVLELSLGALAVLCAPATLACRRPDDSPEGDHRTPGAPNDADRDTPRAATRTWEEFVAEAVPLAERSVARGVHDEADYLRQLVALVASSGWLPPGSSQPSTPPAATRQRVLLERLPVVVCLFELPPGGVIPAHDHRGYNGLFRVIQGQVTCREFERVDSGDDASELRLRELEPQRLGAGGMGMVAMGGANVHELRAGAAGAAFIDLFTFYEADAHSRSIEFVDPSTEPSAGSYQRARWGPRM